MREELTRRRSRQRRQFLGRVFLCALGLVLILGIGVGLYKYRGILRHNPVVAVLKTHFSAWIAERKSHQQDIKHQALAVGTNEFSTKPLLPHFEFYAMLSGSQPIETTSLDSPVVPTSKPIMAKPQEKMAALKVVKQPIVKVQELEQVLLADSLESERYVLQLGEFQSKITAEYYRELLASEGYKAILTNNRNFYRVEFGPFNSKEQAKSKAMALAKQGINTIVKITHRNGALL